MSDKLLRRQSIIEGFKTPHQFAERIMQLEDECRAVRAENEKNEAEHPSCHFPEYREGLYGYVTHMKPLGEMNGLQLSACAVCGTVQAREPVAIG